VLIGEEGIIEASTAAYRQDEPVNALLENVLGQSESDEFDDDILVLWLQREPLGIDWFSPFAADVK
jgi:hypothetical protein